MSQTFRTHGIPLVKRSVRETDRVYSVLSEDRGKLELFATGSRKILSKLAGDMEHTGVLDVFVVRGRSFDRLAGAAPLETFGAVRDSYERQYAVLAMTSFLDRAVRPGERDGALFRLLQEYLAAVTNASLQALADGRLVLAMQWKVFARLGFRPDLEKCVRCRASVPFAQAAFTIRHGGVVCVDCKIRGVAIDATPLTADARTVLGLLLDAPLADATRLFLGPSLRVATHALTSAWSLTHLELPAVTA
jgi:DNA repair protein RecO (recombination protein O)